MVVVVVVEVVVVWMKWKWMRLKGRGEGLELERGMYVRVLSSAHFTEHHSRSRTSSSSFTATAFPTRARLPFFCLLLLAVGASFLLAAFFAIGFFATGFAAGAWELLLWARFGGGFTPCFRCDQALSRFGQWTPFGEVKV